MFVLGVDPGLSVTGYAVVRDTPNSQRLAAVGVIRTDPHGSTAARLRELHDDLAAVIAEHSPAAMAVEQVFTNRNLRTAAAVGRASGVVLLAGARAGIEVFEYTPTQVKLAVVGYGQASKDQVGYVVARRLGLAAPPEPADAADALAIALCHLQTVPMQRAVAGGRS